MERDCFVQKTKVARYLRQTAETWQQVNVTLCIILTVLFRTAFGDEDQLTLR